jgi:hypothetical protein
MFASLMTLARKPKPGHLALERRLGVVHLSQAEAQAYLRAVEVVKPTGLPLELAAKEYVEAWKLVEGKASLFEAAKEFAAASSPTPG